MTIHLYEQLASAAQSLNVHRKRMHEEQERLDNATEALKTQTEYAKAAEDKLRALSKQLGITDEPITLTQHVQVDSNFGEVAQKLMRKRAAESAAKWGWLR